MGVKAALLDAPDRPALHALAVDLGHCAPDAAAALQRCLKASLLVYKLLSRERHGVLLHRDGRMLLCRSKLQQLPHGYF